MKEEGNYTLKRVDKLPKKGNANLLYSVKDPSGITVLYRWLPNGTYEEIPVGASGGGGGNGSPFSIVGSGLPSEDSTDDAYTTGKKGFGETNPAELVDIVGSESTATGSFKLDYTYDSGYISRVAYGGQNILSEVGVGSNTVEGHDIEVFGAGDWSQTRAFQILGDLTGITPVYAGLAYTCGVANFGGSTFGAGMNVYDVGATPADRDFTAVVRVNKGGGYQGNMSARHIGSDAGEDLQPTTGMSVTANSKTTKLVLTPDYFRVNTAIKFEGYGAGTKGQGTTLTDSLAHTGTAATVYGAATFGAGFDSVGNLMEVALASGLEAINEGNGVGHRLIGRDAANFGNIGLNAIDFSTSDSVSSTAGSVGEGTVTFGVNNNNSIKYGLIVGGSNDTSNIDSSNSSNVIFGITNTLFGDMYSNLIVGQENVAGTNGAPASTAVIRNSLIIGRENLMTGGFSSGMIGFGLTGSASGCLTVGEANEDLTLVTSTNDTNTYRSDNPRLIVGCGDYNVASNTFGVKRNGLVVMSTGDVSLPSLTTALIDAASDDSAITKGFLNERINTVKLSLTAAQINSIGTTPIEVIAAPGAGKYIKIISTDGWLAFGTTAFDNNDLTLRTVGGSNAQISINGLLNATANINRSKPNQGSTDMFVANAAVNVTGIDSVAVGDSTVDIYVSYQIITL